MMPGATSPACRPRTWLVDLLCSPFVFPCASVVNVFLKARTVDVAFACPVCERPARANVDRGADWHCPGCGHGQPLKAIDPAVTECVVCGCHELYKKKDFPHWVGMTILVTACLASVYTYFWYEKWLTWAILIGSAIVDGVLYLMVGDAVVCYRCEAHYRGFKAGDAHQPFELTVGERYRQEKIRADERQAAAARRTHPSGPV